MAEYVAKSAAVGIVSAMSRNTDCDCARRCLERAAKKISLLHSADVAPVTSGERVDVGGFYLRRSECDRLLPFDGNYCPYCGVSLKVGGSDGR